MLLKVNGRKGYWVYVEGNTTKKSTNSKSYTLDEAKRVVARLRKEGLPAYYTKGKRPKRALYNAFKTQKSAVIQRAEQVLKELDS